MGEETMPETLEGNGYLFHGDRLVTAVRYRLRATGDEWGRSVVEGEIRPRGHGRLNGHADRYILQAEAGFSVPLELLNGSGTTGWQPFRRAIRKEPFREVG
jgi:hypothetical protein